MIKFSSGFKITNADPIDKRLFLSKAEMITAETTYLLPDKYMAICSDDGKLYLYDSTNTASATTGKYVEINSDLAEVAFSGDYNDLINKLQLTSGAGISITQDSEGNYVISNTAEGIITSVDETVFGVDETKKLILKNIAKSKVNGLESDLNTLSSSVSTLNTKIDNVESAVSGKVDKVTGKGLSTNDYNDTDKDKVVASYTAKHTHSNKALLDTYTQTEANIALAVADKHTHENGDILNATTASFTTAQKSKLEGIEAGAEANVQSDWNESSATADSFIKNKPTDLSDFTNVGTDPFATQGYVAEHGGKIDTISVNNEAQSIVNKNVNIVVPTNTNQLTNGAGYVKQTDIEAYHDDTKEDVIGVNHKVPYAYIENAPTIPTKTSDLTNDSGFITNATNDLTNYIKTTDLAAVATSNDFNDLNNKPTIPSVTGLASETYVNTQVGTVDTKLNHSVIDGMSLTAAADKITVTHSNVNLKTGTTSSEEDVFPLANSTTAGLMSPSDVAAIADLDDRVEALEGTNKRLLYSAKTNPTASEINAFVTGLGYEAPFTGIAVVVNQTFHIWHYYTNTTSWKDDGTDTVSTFTNDTLGVIKGAGEVAGKVYAENDGTGSVYGWDSLVTRVTNAESAITGKQATITSTNKIGADLVDDSDSTNKFVTTAEKATWSGKYSKPTNGIPKSDLASAVQTSLGKADTAVQEDDLAGMVSASTTTTTGYLAKFTGDKVVANGPQLGSSTTTFLNNAGSWTTPDKGVTSVTLKANSPISVDSTSAITTSGERTISHAASGVTNDTYGVESTTKLTPAFGGEIDVPGFTVNTYGHLTSAGSHKVQLPDSVATTTAKGLMSSTDKANFDADHTKLAGIEANANKYTLPTASASTLGGIKVGAGINMDSGVASASVRTYDSSALTVRKMSLADYKALASKDANTLYITE